MVKKKPSAGRRRKEKESAFEQRVRDFSEEVEDMGEKFGKRMEKHGKGWEKRGRERERRGDEWDSWFHNTLGMVGPLVSSIIGIILFVLLTWVISLINTGMGSWILTDVNLFLTSNIGIFFLLFLFFSYASYFSRFHRRAYRLFSPVSVALGAAVGFWVAASAVGIVNVAIGNPVLSSLAFYANQGVLLVFWLFLFLGYLVLAIMLATERVIYREPEERAERPKTPTHEETRRLYRSGRDRILGGVCGGIAEYFGIDPVIVRLLWVIGTLAWGFGILLYIICWIIIPRNPNHKWK